MTRPSLHRRTFAVDLDMDERSIISDLASVMVEGDDYLAATDVEMLGILGKFAKAAEDEIRSIVRNTDATWQQVGDALGISRQAAHKRFSKA